MPRPTKQDGMLSSLAMIASYIHCNSHSFRVGPPTKAAQKWKYSARVDGDRIPYIRITIRYVN